MKQYDSNLTGALTAYGAQIMPLSCPEIRFGRSPNSEKWGSDKLPS